MDVKVGNSIGQLIIEDLGDSWKLSTNQRFVREHVIKTMADRKWHGGQPPAWKRDSLYYTCPKSTRNLFNLNFYRVDTPDPYDLYKRPLERFNLEPRYNVAKGTILVPFPHQQSMADHWWTRKRCHIAAEMRTGKSLPALSVIEHLQKYTWIVAPRSAIAGLRKEIFDWQMNIDPVFMTYDELVKYMELGGMSPPDVVLFDECSKLKSWTTLRTKSAFNLTEAMRMSCNDPYILAMSGTPAPKNPVDIWAQIEVICPGYIKESRPKDLEKRLSLVEYKESETGGSYPHRICWYESDNICAACGLEREAHILSPDNPMVDHPFKKAKNEVALFGERLKGISILFLLKDCTKLPEPIIEYIKVKPSQKVLMYSKQIRQSAAPPATILNDLLQLSAGFYYKMIPHETEKVVCTMCEGELVDPEGNTCTRCEGSGLSPKMYRRAVPVECPKEQLLFDLMEECEESGRIVIFASFQGAIDRIKELVESQGWSTICVDGRGWISEFGNDVECLQAFDNKKKYEKIAFIANPGSGGMGFSLAAASTIFYWSLSFNNEYFLQSIQRCTDLGKSEAVKVVFAIQLQCDQYVIDNLNKKTKLQEILLSELDED